MWYIYIVEYHSAIKKKEMMSLAATRMDLERFTLSEESQRRRNTAWHPLYVESKKKWYKWTYLQNLKRLTDLEKELTVAGGGEEIVREFGKVMYTLLYSTWITSTNCIAHGSCSCAILNVMCQPGWEAGLGENGYMYTSGWVPSLFNLKLPQHY